MKRMIFTLLGACMALFMSVTMSACAAHGIDVKGFKASMPTPTDAAFALGALSTPAASLNGNAESFTYMDTFLLPIGPGGMPAQTSRAGSTALPGLSKPQIVAPVMCTHCSIDDCLHRECNNGLTGPIG